MAVVALMRPGPRVPRMNALPFPSTVMALMDLMMEAFTSGPEMPCSGEHSTVNSTAAWGGRLEMSWGKWALASVVAWPFPSLVEAVDGSDVGLSRT